MCFVTVPHPLGMISKEEVNAKVDAAFDDIVKAATAWTPSKEKQDAQVKPYPAKRFKFSGTYADVNDMFQKRKWSLSLPIVPPTVDKVAAMLKGTKRNPAEVLWVVPPRQGMLTVELVAALGVMAGAKPEHMPLLIATVEAMADPVAAWRGPTTTTAATVPVFFISGPIIEKLKLNPGTGTAGGENPVTNALGYFVNLVGDVVGGSVPPNFDKSTHGSSADLVAMVFTENAKENPWKTTYAEEAGFKPSDSIVTHFSAYLGNANIDHDSKTGQRLLTTLSTGLLGSASGLASCLADYDATYAINNKVSFAFIVLCPEHRPLPRTFRTSGPPATSCGKRRPCRTSSTRRKPAFRARTSVPMTKTPSSPASRRPNPSSSSSRAGRASSPRSGYPSRRCSSPFPRR